MKRKTLLLTAVLVAATLGMAGCAQKPESANSKEAIQKADMMASAEAKTQYLVKEANAFLSSQQFDEAINTAKYVLSKLDSESQEAQSIIQKAQGELKKAAAKKMEEVKKDMKEKLSF